MLVGYFCYVAAIAPWFRDRPDLRYQPVAVLCMVFILLLLVAAASETGFAKAVGVIRDWLPLGLTLVAFREMELFLPPRFEHQFEGRWIRWDDVLLAQWHLRSLIEGSGRWMPICLEVSYMLVYGTGFFCIAFLYLRRQRAQIDRFLIVYLAGTLLAYALFPYFPSEPPRLVFPHLDEPLVRTWARDINLWILKVGTIHAGVFPSAHVSSAFAAAWGMFLVLPKHKVVGWVLVAYAVAVSIATIYGRYHYLADVGAGFAVSLLAGGLCFALPHSSRVAPEAFP